MRLPFQSLSSSPFKPPKYLATPLSAAYLFSPTKKLSNKLFEAIQTSREVKVKIVDFQNKLPQVFNIPISIIYSFSQIES